MLKTVTLARRRGGGVLRRAAGLAAAVAVVWASAGVLTRAATTELVVTDRTSGLALSGFDPVAFFTEGAALEGRREHEYVLEGIAWRFRNTGNRAAFVRDPDVYRPGFGGYDPVALGDGFPVAGDPRLWAVHRQRLYLFSTDANRQRFLKIPAGVLDDAGRAWPAVMKTLSP
ncbi:MAG TPA: YHS domain-containing (seleno)protein [Xanthobacteraceae bacterium]|nr:YHS domain-containing (seleno)protein [Xanthobacteraceae bacterium]